LNFISLRIINKLQLDKHMKFINEERVRKYSEDDPKRHWAALSNLIVKTDPESLTDILKIMHKHMNKKKKVYKVRIGNKIRFPKRKLFK